MLKIVFISILYILSLQADSVSWYGSYDKGLKAANKEKKDMMILLISSKIPESLSIVKKLFMHKSYIQNLNKNYIAILLNVDYKSSYPVELFYTTTFPSLFFASYIDESFLVHPLYKLKEEENLIKIFEKIKNNKN